MIQMMTALFDAVGQGMRVWDHYNKGSYHRKYVKLRKEILDEESKPLFDDNLAPKRLRDQNRIDRLYFDLMLHIGQWNKESARLNSPDAANKP